MEADLQAAERAKYEAIDNKVFMKASPLLQRNGPMTGSDLAKAVGGNRQDTLGAFIRLERDGRFVKSTTTKNGRLYDAWDLAPSSGTELLDAMG